MSINSEDAPKYAVTPTAEKFFTAEEERVIANALAILNSRIKSKKTLASPEDTRNYFRITLSGRECEYFTCLFLDNRHRVIEYEEMFRGTVDGASVHPREVVKAALRHNAAAVIFAHNHPSGAAEPSNADKTITLRLREALALVDVRVLDHFIIGEGEPVSMTERGLI